jgi:hypothetical protein
MFPAAGDHAARIFSPGAVTSGYTMITALRLELMVILRPSRGFELRHMRLQCETLITITVRTRCPTKK